MTSKRISRSASAKPVTAVTVRGLGAVQRSDKSEQLQPDDPFSASAGAGLMYIAPPYDPRTLQNIVASSNMLPQCIAAMVTNVWGSGQTAVAIDNAVQPKAIDKSLLTSFIKSPNSNETLRAVLRKAGFDYETLGYAFLECIPNRTGKLSMMRHAKAASIRIRPVGEETKVSYTIARGSVTAKVTEYRRFPSYVQIVNGQTRYFKAIGDPRKLNKITGEFKTDTKPEDEATSLLHIRQESDDAYGVPRWVGVMLAAMGSRAAEEGNLDYLDDNTIPPALLMVSGGRLTKQSYTDLDTALSGGIGTKRKHKIMLVEAVPESDSLDSRGGSMQVSLEKLTEARQNDALFGSYDKDNQAKIRSAFRLPPVLVGLSQDATFATANVSVLVAEAQVFLPERVKLDDALNSALLSPEQGLGITTCGVRSDVPLMSNHETIIKAMTALNVMGAITPRMANELGNQVLQLDLPAYPDKGEEGYKDWMDSPIIFVTRGENTHGEQALKSKQEKEIEATGNVSPSIPEKGQE